MAAGNKDIKMVGDYDKPITSLINDIPAFTPWNCNFFRKTAEAKDFASNERDKSQKLVSTKVNPTYDKKNHRRFLNKSGEAEFVLEGTSMESSQSLLKKME